MKEVFRGIPDEFMTSNLASQAKVRALLTQSLFLGQPSVCEEQPVLVISNNHQHLSWYA